MQHIWEGSVLWENAAAYLELFRVEPLGDLVLNDGGDAGLDVIQNVFKLKFTLKKINNIKNIDSAVSRNLNGLQVFFF